MRRKASRLARAAAASVACLALVAACSSGGDDEPAGSSQTSDAPAGEPTPGGVINVALSAEPPNLNRGIQTGPEVGAASLPILEGLVRHNSEFKVIPSLAESWDISDDGLTYTFHLREGVTWHDGEPFTSADVLYTFAEVTPLHASASTIVENFESVEAPDDNTVVVTLKEPSAPFLGSLVSENTPILPAHLYEGTDVITNEYNRKPVGTGPFMFSAWTPGQRIELVRNDNYWDEGKPYLDQVIFHIIPDSTTRINSLQSGQIDFLLRTSVDLRQLDQIQQMDNVELTEGVGSVSHYPLYMNTARGPLQDPEVRKAVVQGINRQLIVDSVFSGHATPATSFMPGVFSALKSPDVNYDELYPFDIEAAGEKLDDLGYPVGSDGTRFELDFVYSAGYGSSEEIVQVVVATLNELGVKVNPVQREVAVYTEQVFTDRDFDLATNTLGSRTDPSLGVDRTYRCNDETTPFVNPTGYCNERLDELFAEANVALDEQQRAEFYHEAQQIVADDLPSLIMVEVKNYDLLSTRFGGREAFFDVSSGVAEHEYKELWVKEQ